MDGDDERRGARRDGDAGGVDHVHRARRPLHVRAPQPVPRLVEDVRRHGQPPHGRSAAATAARAGAGARPTTPTSSSPSRPRSASRRLDGRDRRSAGDAVPELLQGVRDAHRWPSILRRMSREGTRRALVTGIGGQDGSLLAELLLERGYEVFGVVRRGSTDYPNLAGIRDRLQLIGADLLDRRSLEDTLREVQPHELYNLASVSFVPASWDEPVLTAEFAAVGVTTVLEAIRRVDPEIRFYQASSSEIFGEPAGGAADRADAAAAADALRRREGVRALHRRQLPPPLRPARLVRDPLQPRVAAAPTRLPPAQGLARGRADRGGAAGRALGRRPRRAARLGLGRGLRPGDVADAPAGPRPTTT